MSYHDILVYEMERYDPGTACHLSLSLLLCNISYFVMRVKFLPSAYLVRREGNVLTRVCPSIHLSVQRGGGYPYPIVLCNISQNAMGQIPGGGDPTQGVPCRGSGGTQVEYPARGGVPS